MRMAGQMMPPNFDRIGPLLLEEVGEIGIFLISPERRITSWSRAIQTILGYNEDEFVGLDAAAIFTPEDRAKGADNAEFETASATGRATDMRWHLRQDGGRTFVDGVLISFRDEDGTLTGFCKLLRNAGPDSIENSMLSAILDRTPEAIYIKDREGRFTFANSQTGQILGTSVEKIVGHYCTEFQPPELSAISLRQDQEVIESGRQAIVEEQIDTADRGPRTYLTGKAPFLDREGKTIGVVSIAQDISERKAADDERERLLRELRQSNEDLAQFASVVSHDLQAPLRVLTSYTQLLSQRYAGKLDETADQFIGVILGGAASMQELIQSLLRYAQAGDEALMRVPVSVDAIIDGVRSNLDLELEESGAELIHGPLPVVTADAVQLLQLFQNLVANAIKYSKPGVRPRIEIKATRSDNNFYRFEVRDNGIGIDPRYFDVIFAPLKRLHGANIPGSGIGLAVCRRIVERQGGRIWVTSERGKGSTFVFILPSE